MSTETNATAPEDYKKCPNACGRWTHPINRVCWGCFENGSSTVSKATKEWRPDWSPPIPAPVKPVERRAGQRHRRPGGRISTLVAPVPSGWTYAPPDPGGVDIVGNSWMDNNWTLIADATEAGKPFVSRCVEMCKPGKCKDCDREVSEAITAAKHPERKSPPVQEAPPLGVILQGSNDGQTWIRCASSFGCSHRQHRAVQEAPKAAPVCDIARDTHAGPVLMRWIKVGQGAVPSLTPVCEQCHVLSERAGRFGGVFPASILHDKDVPTRLPRPQLAVDWVEDCLPTVWR